MGKQVEEMPFGGGLLKFTPQLVTPQRFPFENPKTTFTCKKGGQKKSTTSYRKELEISQQEAYSEFGKKGH